MIKAIDRAFSEDSEDGKDFGEALVANDYSKAEELLLRKCSVRFPRSHEVYADWKTQLAPFESPDQTVSLRITSCDRRLEQPARAGTKTLESLLLGNARGLPIYCHTNGGFLPTYVAWRHLPWSDVEKKLRADMFRTDRDMRLAELAADGEAFRCPLAESRLCDASESRCFDGMKDLDLLPTSEGCSVRRSLKDAGWSLKGEIDERKKMD